MTETIKDLSGDETHRITLTGKTVTTEIHYYGRGWIEEYRETAANRKQAERWYSREVAACKRAG